MLAMHVPQERRLSKLSPTEDDAATVRIRECRRLVVSSYEHLPGDILPLGDIRSRPSEGEAQLEQNGQAVPFSAQVEKDDEIERKDSKPCAREVTLPPNSVGQSLREHEERKNRAARQFATADVFLELLRLLPCLAYDNLVAIATRGSKSREGRRRYGSGERGTNMGKSILGGLSDFDATRLQWQPNETNQLFHRLHQLATSTREPEPRYRTPGPQRAGGLFPARAIELAERNVREGTALTNALFRSCKPVTP